ncbi:MAG TPA: hypothetical protein VFO10_18275 [Oligoflexus sp.]|uniref:hypothetical protein n=1 Tax=Oligoflexus sp. TaxID=1971216 RepID=UPI002D80A14A|nr:hypothetical protein [Oligoflexus sp.]HET9239213.1 hypothetical protein [Oligoflexus sp.]
MRLKMVSCLAALVSCFVSQAAKSEDNTLVWHQDLVSDSAMKQIGAQKPGTYSPNAVSFSLADGVGVVSSPCTPNPIRSSGMAGYISGNTVVQLGNRPVSPTSLEFQVTWPGGSGGSGSIPEYLSYDMAFQTFEEIRALFPDNKARFQVLVRGTLDRCPNQEQPDSRRPLEGNIHFYVRCSKDGRTGMKHPALGFFPMTIWQAPGHWRWPDHEQMPIDKAFSFDFDTTACDGPLFLTARFLPAARFEIKSLEVQLWN